MKSLYVMGGQQRYLRPFMADDREWYEYEKGIILQVNPETEQSRTLIEYMHPPEIRELHGNATLFKSGAIRGDTLYACTQTEILIYQLPEARQIGYISLPSFNDVHHVRPTSNGTLLVASSGLDMILEITDDGDVVREWSSLEEPVWSHFSKDIDYRPISTKPHRSHPNHLFFIGDELWTTRFCQRDAISLRDRSRRIEIGVGSPHDGLEHGDYVYFTTVNGNIIIANKRTLKTEEVLDLNVIHGYGGPLGWCRGILTDGDRVWVGFSRIRPTQLRENVEWIKRNLKWRLRPLVPSMAEPGNGRRVPLRAGKEYPSHIACYDLFKKTCVTEMNLEPHGISAIFSIFSR